MGPGVSLLNDYKQQFLWKRFTQTILGGPRFKLGFVAPPYIYVNQVILFLVPWLLGGVATLLHQLQILEEYQAALLSGGMMLCTAAVEQALALHAKRRTGRVEQMRTFNILADEEEVEFNSCTGPEAIHFLIPGKRFALNRVLHVALAGVLCGLGTWYLLVIRLSSLYGSTVAAVVIFILGWVTLCIASYSLIINTAVETATFQPQDTYEIAPLTRPLYVILFVAVDLAHRLADPSPALLLSSQVLHVLFLFLPIIWALGLLSPPDALFLWGMEEALVFGFGGSPMATNLRLLAMFVVSTCVAVCTFFISSSLGVLLFTTAMGFLLSLDFSQVVALVPICRADARSPESSLGLGWKLGWREGLLYLILFLVAMVEAGLLHHLVPLRQSWSWGLQSAFSCVMILLFIVIWVLRQVQGVYLLGGVFHNPLYPKKTTSVGVYKELRRGLSMVGMIGRVLVSLVCPFCMIAFLATDDSLLRLHTVSLSVGFTRASRMVWQDTEGLMFQVAVVAIVHLACGSMLPSWWYSLGTGVQLILVDLASDRVLQFALKLKFSLTVLVTSWTEKKERRPSTVKLLALNGLLSPLLLATLALSSVLSAPLLPLFTLPVFLVGFPRPRRSWPGPVGTACPCSDTMYYQQMSRSLASSLQVAFATGELGSPSPGSHFLGRFHDRVLWITVLERGFGYCCVNIKGLELQETSCHTAEARRVDEVFESAFKRLPPHVNPHWENVLTPCTLLPVRVYSDARSVLIGIIDSPDNLQHLRDDFPKVLVWVLLQHCLRTQKTFTGGGRESTQSWPTAPPTPFSVKLRWDNSNLNSVGDWSDDDDLFGPHPAKKTSVPASIETVLTQTSLPGSVEPHLLFGDAPDFSIKPLQPLGLGLPAVDKGWTPEKQHLSGFVPPRVKRASLYSELLSLPQAWCAAPIPTSSTHLQQSTFPVDWFHFALGHMDLAGQDRIPEVATEALRELHSKVVLGCLLSLGAEAPITSPNYVFRVYCGDVPWTEGLVWLKSNTELFQLTLKAFRYSLKLLFDQASLGAVESPEELLSILEEYEKDWYIGLEFEQGWQEAILQEKPFLFSLGHDIRMATYTGRVLSMQELLVQLGRLNGEAVRGQWANLSWELLYATNDDEERYSIQAHPVLLRNMTVQAADPPLGYPIYSSAPLHLPRF